MNPPRSPRTGSVWRARLPERCSSVLAADAEEGDEIYNTVVLTDCPKSGGHFSAHDNLILLFRAIMELTNATDYFPELTMHDGRLHRVDENGGRTDLEVETATGPGGRRQLQRFMDFLNAKRLDHDMQEVLQSARVIHWANEDPVQRDLQVEVANDILQTKMARRYARWYDIDGRSDTICALIADIHHQGRGSRDKVKAVLRSDDPVEKLITINPNYTGRIEDLRTKLAEMTASGQLGQRTYNAGQNEFR